MKSIRSLNFVSRIFSILFAMALSAVAMPGDPDTTFGGAGTTRFGFGGGYDAARAVAVQPDGKLIVAGGSQKTFVFSEAMFSLVRFDANNVLDPSFGEGGKVLTRVCKPDLPFADARINSVKIQSDGKIVAGGYASTDTNLFDFTLARYHTNGTLDTTFGTNGTGIVYTHFDNGAVIRGIAIQSDGKIVAVGYTNYPANATEGAVALARYDTNGVLDGTFGVDGIQITSGIVGYTGAHAVLVQADGKILAVGIGIGSGHNGIDFALYRYTTNGFLDSDFGGGTGRVFTQISTNNNNYFDSANAVAIQAGDDTIVNPDKIVVAGSYRENISDRTVFAIARYSMAGILDTTFGGNGIVTNVITPGAGIFDGDIGTSLVVQGLSFQPRKITVGGYSSSGTTGYFTLARYNANGTFDTSFGTNGTGYIRIDFPPGTQTFANALALQSGKYVLAGYTGVTDHNFDYTIARFNSDGSRDSGFGNGGLQYADIADLDSTAQGVAVQPDGKVVVVGTTSGGASNILSLARLNPNGSLDASFGDGGKVKTLFGAGTAVANAVLIQPDEKIVVAGSGIGSSDDFAVLRYNPNGTLDTSFGTNGIAMTAFGPNSDIATSMALQADGKIVVAGITDNGANNDFAIARYTTNGVPDSTFDSDGKVTVAIATGNDSCNAVKIQPDGKIVVAGYTEINGNIDVALVRLNTNGMLDNSFGSFGRVATDIGGTTIDAAFGLAIQPDRKIVIGGYTATGANIDVAVLRYNTNGVLDNTFDGDGKVVTPIGLSIEYASSIALQSDGKIVVAGLAGIGAHNEFAAVRYETNGTPDATFGLGGKTVVDFGDNADNTGLALALDSMGRAVIAGNAGNLFGVARLQGDPFLTILSITRTGSGTNVLTGMGSPGSGHTLHAAGTLNGGNFTPLGPVAVDAAGMWQYEDTALTGVSNRFYRLSLP